MLSWLCTGCKLQEKESFRKIFRPKMKYLEKVLENLEKFFLFYLKSGVSMVKIWSYCERNGNFNRFTEGMFSKSYYHWSR